MGKAKRHTLKRVREAASARTNAVEVQAGVFKNKCLRLLDDVRDKRIELVVTKHGKPVARVVPMEQLASAGDDSRSSCGWMRAYGPVIEVGDIVGPDFEAWGEYA